MPCRTEIITTSQEHPDAVVLTTTRTTTVTEAFNSFDEAKRGLVRRGLVEATKTAASLFVGTGGILGGLGLVGSADGDVKKALVGSGLSIVGGILYSIYGRRMGERAQRDEVIADQLGHVRDLIMPTEERTEAEAQNTPFL